MRVDGYYPPGSDQPSLADWWYTVLVIAKTTEPHGINVWYYWNHLQESLSFVSLMDGIH